MRHGLGAKRHAELKPSTGNSLPDLSDYRLGLYKSDIVDLTYRVRLTGDQWLLANRFELPTDLAVKALDRLCTFHTSRKMAFLLGCSPRTLRLWLNLRLPMTRRNIAALVLLGHMEPKQIERAIRYRIRNSKGFRDRTKRKKPTPDTPTGSVSPEI